MQNVVSNDIGAVESRIVGQNVKNSGSIIVGNLIIRVKIEEVLDEIFIVVETKCEIKVEKICEIKVEKI